MKQIFFASSMLTLLSCHEPCKDGYGRASDNLCYRLADDPVAPCGEDMARTDDGECVSVTSETDATPSEGGDETGAAGGTGSATSGGTSSGTTGGSDGPANASAGGGGGDVGAGPTGGTSTGGDESFGSATIGFFLNKSDGSEFSAGDKVLIQAWTGDMIEAESGWPLDEFLDDPRESQVAEAAISARSIVFNFVMADVPASGEEIRITAHLTEDPLEWEDSPAGTYPPDPGEWLLVTAGSTTSDVMLYINTGEGEASAGSPLDGGVPPDGTDPGGAPAGDPPPGGGGPVGDGGPPDGDGGPGDGGPPDGDGGGPDEEPPDTGTPGGGA